MAKKNNKITKKYYQVYGINNCMPIIKNSCYNIINIFISEDKVSKYKNIIGDKNNSKKIRYINKSIFHHNFSKC